MIIYSYHDSHFYEVHLNMDIREVSFILRWRDGHEQRPTRLLWDDLDSNEQDHLLNKIRGAVKKYDKANT